MKESKPKKKKGFLDGYKTYNPAKEGYGNRSQWKANFRERMGLDEANAVLGDDDPHVLLGLIPGKYTRLELKKAYRRGSIKWHPDVCKRADAEKMYIKIQAAYCKLDAKFA